MRLETRTTSPTGTPLCRLRVLTSLAMEPFCKFPHKNSWIRAVIGPLHLQPASVPAFTPDSLQGLPGSALAADFLLDCSPTGKRCANPHCCSRGRGCVPTGSPPRYRQAIRVIPPRTVGEGCCWEGTPPEPQLIKGSVVCTAPGFRTRRQCLCGVFLQQWPTLDCCRSRPHALLARPRVHPAGIMGHSDVAPR